MEQLPVFLNLRGRTAVVVGGGVVAARKAELLGQCGARLRVVASRFAPAMRALAAEHSAEVLETSFDAGYLAGAELVVAATDDKAVNRAVHEAAQRLGVPVNVVDTPELCSFTFGAIVDRAPVTIAISTGGRSPVLARHVKALLERGMPSRLGRLADLLGRLRHRVAARIPDARERRRWWESLLASDVPALVYAAQDATASAAASALLDDPGRVALTAGRVFLIGAGPGDPELLTLRAQRLLQTADVVLYDRLVPVGVLGMCRREAELVYVGKRVGDHAMAQEDISALLVRHARAGKRVARLKGGDPFVFGRGGEELDCLVRAGIGFEVVPGVSAANGCAAYAGIPLTHRDHAQSVSFYTAHSRDGGLELDWPSMVGGRRTLVFYMGVASAGLVSERLIAHGIPPTMPAAIVEAGTTDAQRVHRTSLHRLADAAAHVDSGLPAIIIVGTVVNLRRDLGWFAPASGDAHPVFPAHRPAMTDVNGIDAA